MEIARRKERKAKLAQAKAEIEARAHARFVSEQATYYESVPSVSSNGVRARRNLASFKFGSGSLKDKH